MRLRRRHAGDPVDPTEQPQAPPGRLGGVPRLTIDDEERPNREDLEAGVDPFMRQLTPPGAPRWLVGKRRRRRD